jgi:hypothetical protein
LCSSARATSASGLPTQNTQQIGAIAQALRTGRRFPELIAAQADDGTLILIEGHSRATAYVIEHLAGDVEGLIASSPSMPLVHPSGHGDHPREAGVPSFTRGTRHV